MLDQARLRTLNACDFGDLLLHNITILSQHADLAEHKLIVHQMEQLVAATLLSTLPHNYSATPAGRRGAVGLLAAMIAIVGDAGRTAALAGYFSILAVILAIDVLYAASYTIWPKRPGLAPSALADRGA